MANLMHGKGVRVEGCEPHGPAVKCYFKLCNGFISWCISRSLHI